MTTSIAQKNRFTLFAIALSLIAVVTVAQDSPVADVNPAQLQVNENESAEVLCTAGHPLSYCRIEVPGSNVLILNDKSESRNTGYSYYGRGLAQGQCGVRIRQVSARNHGLVKCYLGLPDEEAYGQSMLTVALPPGNPELVIANGNQHGTFELGQTIQLQCSSPNGRPAAKLTWLLDDEPLYEQLSREEVSESLASNNQTLYTARQTLTRQIRAGDDHKTVRCVATHGGQVKEARVQLRVRYQPQAQPQIRVFGVVQGNTALINVTISANPRPRVSWIIDSEQIQEGGQSGRYEVYEVVDLGNGMYNATLAIAGLTLEDTTKEYTLRANNELGAQDYSVRISSSEAAAITGLDVGAIVGIAVGVAVLVLIVALVVVARLTGKWCFSASTSSSESGSNLPTVGGGGAGGETSDTESADPKQHKKKFSINFAGLFARKPQPDEDVEARTTTEAEDGNDDATRSEATVILEDDPPKGGEKNLVYAELMLKPGADQSPAGTTIIPANQGGNEATEYAEIVYVSPTAGGKPDQQKMV